MVLTCLENMAILKRIMVRFHHSPLSKINRKESIMNKENVLRAMALGFIILMAIAGCNLLSAIY
jgi:hypothetical protein